jgi:hypothetical protein
MPINNEIVIDFEGAGGDEGPKISAIEVRVT